MLNQDQWYDKLRKFVPSWWFEKEHDPLPDTPAVFRAIAAVFSGIEEDRDDHFNATFYTKSEDPILDLLADERGKERLTNESDSSLSDRSRRITSQTDLLDIQAAVDAYLRVPGCVILEAPDDNPFCDRSNFCGRDNYINNYRQDFFTIITPKQIHQPYSYSGQSYAGQSYASTIDSTNDAYAAIIALVNSMKAFGVLYRIVESNRSVVN